MSTLYAEHFHLKEAPFSIAPNPRFLFMSDQHREALAHLLYGIGHDGGFVLLTGEVGTGKTTLCRCLLEKVPEDTDVAFIINPRLSVVDLLANICDELHIGYDAERLNNRLLVDAINRYLLDRHAEGRKTVLVIDEAQNLDADVLEQLRLLTNLETDERKLLQIILLGQPELQDKLNRPELRQLSQRVTARYHLQALSHQDMQAYITHRLGVAGCDQSIFAPSALRFLHRRSQGIPRLINLICDRAMLGAFARGVSRIEKPMIQQAAREVLGEQTAGPESKTFRPGAAWAVAGVLLIIAAWTTGRWMIPQNTPLVAEPTAAPAKPRITTAPHAPALTATRTIDPVAEPPAESTDPGQPLTESVPLAESATEAAATEAAATEAVAAEALTTEAATAIAPISPTAEQAPSIPWVQSGFLHNRHGAFSDLFKAWGMSLPERTEPCTFARSRSLTCQRFSGDVGILRSLDRPAIIDWHREDGGMSYITAVSLDDASIRAVAGSRTFELPIEQLRQHWRGGFTVLWRTPPGYQSDILPGTVGPLAKWLNGRLSALESDPPGVVPEQVSGLYIDDRVQSLRRFQRQAGLLPDGVAGPQTLIHLNTALDEAGPRLRPDTGHIEQAAANP